MARYIDADKLNADFLQTNTANADIYLALRKILDKAPTADVVPRAEVEELKVENERLTNLLRELTEYNEAWVEDNGKLRKKNKNLAREIFELVECAFSPVLMYEGHTIKAYIAELKKKYTGGDQT